MNFRKLFLPLLLLPFAANAQILFSVTNKLLDSHAGHVVRAPVLIVDIDNKSTVMNVGLDDYFRAGLMSGEQRSVVWEAGWIYNRNISGPYKIMFACNIDGKIYGEPATPIVKNFTDNSFVNIHLICDIGEDGKLKTPTATVQVWNANQPYR